MSTRKIVSVSRLGVKCVYTSSGMAKEALEHFNAIINIVLKITFGESKITVQVQSVKVGSRTEKVLNYVIESIPNYQVGKR